MGAVSHTQDTDSIPTYIIFRIFSSLYFILLDSLHFRKEPGSADSSDLHYCSLRHPCATASAIFSSLYTLRLVSKEWDHCFLELLLGNDYTYFQRVEDAYYPHAWHINTKIRKTLILGRYRVFKTIDTEEGERGVFQAFSFSGQKGCSGGQVVVIKGWLNSGDNECQTESRVYDILKSWGENVIGTPRLLDNGFDKKAGLHALVIEKLGPTLEDVIKCFPGSKLPEELVLAVAIQMIDRYAALHKAGIIHNGIKPGNICLSPYSPISNARRLNLIDFGLSYLYDASATNPLPSVEKAPIVGNRRFLSINAHHGISHCQRDDLESLGYLLSCIFHGSLPWDNIPTRSKSVKLDPHGTVSTLSSPNPHIWPIKMSTPGTFLFRGMDPSFLQYWKDVKSLSFGETPDYGLLKSRFLQSWESRQLGGTPGEVDWFEIFDSTGLF